MKDRISNIILIGFASTGKTVTGRVLADMLGFSFVDLDERVEALHSAEWGVNRRCREIFSLYGRDCFIHYETRALNALVDSQSAVIAVGGGAPLSEVNRNRIRNLGCVVYLNASSEAIFERMKIKGFPEYFGENPSTAALETLTSEREPIYKETADIIIDNTRLLPKEAASAIIARLTEHGLLQGNLVLQTKDNTL